MGVYSAKIEYMDALAPGIYRIGLRAAGISAGASAGQFYMIRVSEGLHPLLRRPFALHRRYLSRSPAVPQGDGLEVLFQVVGVGTRLLAQKAKGQHLDVIGPLGRGWRIEEKARAVLVGGGIGVASLLALAEQLTPLLRERSLVLLGARDRESLIALDDFYRLGMKTKWIVERPPEGLGGGTVLDLLEREREAFRDGDAILYACGPQGMISAVARWALQENGVRCQVSLETRMACGMGLCLGCAVKGQGDKVYRKVCQEGPVFDAEEIDWEAWDEQQF